MKRKIPCFCDNSFSVEVPEEIDLDAKPGYITEILNGSFMNFTCPSCGKKHKPEFPVVVNWSAKNIRLEVLPELDRGEFYRRKRKAGKRAGAEDSVPALETVIGYPELADRIAIIQDDLEPAAVESLKYYLLLKAEESLSGEKEISVWYHGKNKDALEFHLYGIREEEVAVTRVPFSIYERTLEDYKKHPKGEIFTFLRSGSYLSIQNMLRPDALK